MRMLVCGGRSWDNYEVLAKTLNMICILRRKWPTVLIHGASGKKDHKTGKIVSGADLFAGQWARSIGVEEATYPADWDTCGLGAGPIRNQQMLVEGRPDLVVAFPGGAGTANMVAIAKYANVEVIEVELRHDNEGNSSDSGTESSARPRHH